MTDPLMSAVFTLDGPLAIPSVHAAGPWNPDLQHGAAPAALIARAVEQVASAAPMRVARLTIDLMRPVPLRPLQVHTEVLREGRKIQIVQVVLRDGATELVRATALRVRLTEQPLPPHADAAGLSMPPPESGHPPTDIADIHNPFLEGVEMRVVRGAFRTSGPAAAWFRLRRPIVAGETISPLMRAAATADFCNGTSAVLDLACWTFVSADLTLSLSRDPVGDWILLDAESWLAPNGGGIAAARLADRAGDFGRAVQSLLIEAR